MLAPDGLRVYSNIFCVNDREPLDKAFPDETEDFVWDGESMTFSWGKTGVNVNDIFYPGKWEKDGNDYKIFVTDKFTISTADSWYRRMNLDRIKFIDFMKLLHEWNE